MATLSAARAASTLPVFRPTGAGLVCAAYGAYTLAANPTAADIIEFCRVPAGAVVVGGWLMGADLDTNATETFEINLGWAANGDEVADPDGFGDLGVSTGDVSVHLGAAGLYYPLQGVLMTAGPKTFNAETIIQGTVVATAATGGTGVLTLVVLYVVP